MAFITMPAPKVGTTFYDKPGNARKLYRLKRLQDNKVICTPANDDGKEALILPIEAWEKLTGYKIGPDLLATMTFSPRAPVTVVAAVPELAEGAKPAEAKPAKPAKPTKAAKAAKPASTPAPKATEAPVAPLATPISQDFARQLTEILKGQPVWMRLAGDRNAATRQKIMEALTGVKTPKNKSGVNAIEKILLGKLGIDTTNTTIDEQGKLITARLNEIANNAPSPATAPPLAPASTVTVGDGVELVIQPLRTATPAEIAAAEIVKPALPPDAQPMAVEIRQIYLNGDSGNLTNINPQRLEAMVANIRNKKRADNGEIVVEMWAPDPQCAFGASQHGPLAQYKIVAGIEQFQAIRYFLEQNGAPPPIDNYKIPVMLTQPAEPELTDQQIEQAIVDGINDFMEPITFTQPDEPEALDAEDYDEQGRLRPSAMNKKQVKEAIAELVADGWRLVTKRDMGSTKMRLVHEEKRIASYPGNSERFLLIAMRTKMYGPNAKYFQDWLDEEGVQPPTPTALAQPEAEHEEPTETEAAAAHWEALAKAQEAAAQSEIDQGLPRGDVSSFTARANTYHQVATDLYEKAANMQVAAAAPQPAVETPTSNRIEVKLEQLTFPNASNVVPEAERDAIVQNLQEYGPQATDITACVSSYNPNIYRVLSGDEYVTAAVRLKWESVTITVVETPCEPIIEQRRADYVGHNANGQALYQDANGVRSIISGDIIKTEPVLLIPARGGGITTGTNRTYRPEYKTRAELEAEKNWAAVVAASAQASAHTTKAPRSDEEIAAPEAKSATAALPAPIQVIEGQTVKGVESYAPEAPTPTAEGPFTQPVLVMGVGDQITVAGAAMLDEKQPKVHYYPGKVDLLFGLYPPTKMNGRNFINLGSSGSFIMPKETREGHSIVSDMLMQLGVDLARPQHFGTTLQSPIATTGAQGIIGYDNYADPLNGEANRFNRTSGLIESNQFLTWRCNIPGFWRIHIAYDASDTYTVRMWRALDPLISKAVGEVVEEFDNVYFPDLRRLVDLIYDHACNKYNDGTIDLDSRDWAPLMNPNIPTSSSSRPAPRRRQ